MHFEFKYLIVILSILLIVGGLYFKFLYDVPDGQDKTNSFVSWILVIIGIIGIMISALWKKRITLQIDRLISDDSSPENDSLDDKRRNRTWKR